MTSDIGCFRAREIEDGGSDVLGHTEPTGWDRPEQPRLLLRCELVGHRRDDRAGRNAIYGYAASGDFGGDRLRHADHPRLGACVVGLSGIAGKRNDRGYPDDAAMPAPQHAAEDQPGEPESGGQIDFENRLKIGVGHPQR